MKTPEIPVPAPRSAVAENEIREMDDDERMAPEMVLKPCLHCLEDKPPLYKMIRNNELDFFCSQFCTEEFKSESSLCDVLSITTKRVTILRHPLLDPQDCVACDKAQVTCRFKFTTDGQVKYLCDDPCLDKHTDKNWDKFAVHLAWFHFEEATDSTATCCKCHTENKECTLKLSQQGAVDNAYPVCDGACRDALLIDLPADAQPKKAEFVLHLDDLDQVIVDDECPLPRCSADAERLKLAQDAAVARVCHNCESMIEEAGLSHIHWQFQDFCCGDCLFEFHKKLLANAEASAAGPLIGKCTTCMEDMAVDDKVGRFMILHGQETKTFCNESCLVRFKEQYKVCLSCRKSVVKEQQPQPSEWEEMVTDSTAKESESRFCSDSCNTRFDRTIARIKLGTGTETTVQCHVCTHVKQIAVTCQVNNRLISLCSQACLSAFKFANNVDPHSCRTCNRFFERSAKRNFTIYSFSGDTSEAYSFCTRSCRDLYVVRDALVNVVGCSWCGIAKKECDLMRLRPFGDTYKPSLVCTVECERMLRFVVEQRNERLKDTWSCTFCQKTADFDVQKRLLLLPAIIGDSSSWRSFCSGKCAKSSVGEELLDASAFDGCLRRLTKESLTSLMDSLLKPRPTLSVRDGASLQALTNGASSDDDDDRGAEDSYAGTHYDDYAPSGNMSPPPLESTRRGRGRPPIKIRTQPAIASRKTPPAPAPEIRTQILTVGPPPTVVRNISTMCRPIMESRGVMARPKKVSVECQTDSYLEKKYYIPIPVPIYVPTPLPMYSLPVPTPVPIAIPIPVPVFIPTTRNSAEGIMKEIKKIQEKMPTDPYEAELLLMAEMVADDAAKSDDSDSDDDRPLKSLMPSNNAHGGGHQMEYHHLGSHAVAAHATVGGGQQGTGMEGEDMLMMALKMAYDEPQPDLEATMQANTITQGHEIQHHHQQQYDQYGMPHHPQDAYIGHHQQQQQQQQGHSLLLLESANHMQSQEVVTQTRGRKRGGARGAAVGRAVQAQPAAVIQPPPVKRSNRNRSPPTQTYAEQHQREMEKSESNMCLKVRKVFEMWVLN